MYKKIPIQRYKVTDIVSAEKAAEDFDIIDGFEASIRPYIYSPITMTDYTEPIEKAFQSRLQILVSSILLRGILLKQGLVQALNDNNFPTYYATLKSFLEVPALLGYICHLLQTINDPMELIKKLHPLMIGTREAGPWSVGSLPAINVLSLFGGADHIIAQDHTRSGATLTEDEQSILVDLYKDVCNFAHINWNAHLSVGNLKDGVWTAKTDAVGYKAELWAFYMPSFAIAAKLITTFCGRIVNDPKVSDYSLLSTPNYYPPELE